MSKFTLFTQSFVIITHGVGSLQALVIYVEVKEIKAFHFVLEIIIVDGSIRGRIHPITSTHEKRSGHMVSFVMPHFPILSYKGMSFRPGSGTF